MERRSSSGPHSIVGFQRAAEHGKMLGKPLREACSSRTALGKEMRESIVVGDLVNVSCERGIWTVVGSRVRNLEPKFQVQLGEDPSTVHWVQSDVVTLMQKASTASH